MLMFFYCRGMTCCHDFAGQILQNLKAAKEKKDNSNEVKK